MRCLAFCLLFLLPMVSDGQNLVPNPSFEEYTECPYGNGQIDFVEHWDGINGHPYFYHECGINGFDIPANEAGWGYAKDGQAYVEIPIWAKVIPNANRFLTVELLEPLADGVKYHAQFYVSLCDSVWYAARNFGMHFANNPHPDDVLYMLTLNPQVSYSDTSFLDDKIRWTRISGSFIAQGGERHLAIGNFDSDSETDTTFVPGGGIINTLSGTYWSLAAYYVDDVSVMPDSVYMSTHDLKSEVGLELYPNPASAHITVNCRVALQQVRVLDVRGRMVLEQALKQVQGDVKLNTNDLPSGIYMLEAITQNGARVVRKFVLER